jgi:hypothetical protein
VDERVRAIRRNALRIGEMTQQLREFATEDTGSWPSTRGSSDASE